MCLSYLIYIRTEPSSWHTVCAKQAHVNISYNESHKAIKKTSEILFLQVLYLLLGCTYEKNKI